MITFNRRTFRSFDWINFFSIVALCIISLLFVFSATYQPSMPLSIFFKKQLLGACLGLFIYFACIFINWHRFIKIGYTLYFVVIGLLMFTILKGTIGMGAQRWINLVFFRFQPSELAKFLFPPFFVYFFKTYKNIVSPCFKDFAFPIFNLFIATILILKQPDLGTALLFFFSGLTLMWLCGIKAKVFLLFAIFLAVNTPILWKVLKPYQKQRVFVFLGQGDERKERYQIEQAKIAIGSGGITGKGYLKGTQNKLMFLPEGRTDFIFAVLCEEWGFLGALLVILLYIILFSRLILVISKITDFYAQTLSIGLLLYTIFATTINIGMVIGLLPIVGIPLPFLSYGISHLWISFASFGMIESIVIRELYTGFQKKL